MLLGKISKLAALMLVALASGCSIMHPVAEDYPQYLSNNVGAAGFQPVSAADQYYLMPKTQSHRYEFRSAMVGAAHLWIVEFGQILDATLRSQDVMNAFGPLGKASSDTTPGSNTIVFDLQDYTFQQFGAHFILTIAVKNSTGEVFKKTYYADGKTQGGKMFWAGPFGMKNAIQQSTKLAMDQVISTFIIDLKAAGIQGAPTNGSARPVAVTPLRAAPQAPNTLKTPVAAPDMRPAPAPSLGSEAAPAPALERQVIGEELRAHFASLRTIIGSSSSIANVRLDLKPGGSLSLRDNSGGISSYGYYRIYAAENKVCTTINTYTGYAWYSSHKALQDCYRLFTTEANKFILRSITDKTFIAYVRN
jgi:hypothetical protein